MIPDIASDAFRRVQRFSTDWHANSFAGSTVRKITRGKGRIDFESVHLHCGNHWSQFYSDFSISIEAGERSVWSARQVPARPPS